MRVSKAFLFCFISFAGLSSACAEDSMDEFADSIYQLLNRARPEKFRGNPVICDAETNLADLDQFFQSCAGMSPKSGKFNRLEIERAGRGYLADEAYRLKFKHMACRAQTIESFHLHEDIGVLSGGGQNWISRLPVIGNSEDPTPKIFHALNSSLSGEELGSKPLVNKNQKYIYYLDIHSSLKKTDIVDRQLLVTEHLYSVIQSLNKIALRQSGDIQAQSAWTSSGRLHDCIKDTYQARIDQRQENWDEILEGVWGGQTPEIRELLDNFARRSKIPSRAEFFSMMLDQRGLQGIIQKMNDRTLAKDISGLKEDLTERKKFGSFSRTTREDFFRDGYTYGVVAAITPKETDKEFDPALLAINNFICEMRKTHDVGPVLLEKNSAAALAVFESLLALIPLFPNKAKAINGLMKMHLGSRRARAVRRAAGNVGKLALVHLAIQTQSKAGADNLERINVAKKIGLSELCFKDDIGKTHAIDSGEFENLSQLLKSQNESAQAQEIQDRELLVKAQVEDDEAGPCLGLKEHAREKCQKEERKKEEKWLAEEVLKKRPQDIPADCRKRYPGHIY